MAYFVTGATGFIGRHLVQELLDNRDGEIFVLVRAGSQARIERLLRSWGNPARVTTVDRRPDQAAARRRPRSGSREHRGSIDHFFHLAALYDMTASDELNEQLNVGGTRAALELAGALDAGVFHQVSSIAASGDYHGTFDETMFDVGQGLPSPYHRTKFESERIVREECPVPWRVYRPAVVVGHSETGAMDKVDGPYYFFPLFKRLRDTLPAVAAAGRRRPRRHQRGAGRLRRQGDGPHRPPARARRPGVPPGQPRAAATVDVVNTFADGRQGAAVRGARSTGGSPACCRPALLPRALRPGGLVQSAAAHRARPAGCCARPSAGSASRPRCSSTSPSRRCTPPAAPSGRWPGPGSPARTSRGTPRRCGPTGRSTSTGTPPATAASPTSSRDRTVVITGASSGIGKVVALKVAQAGGIPILVARGKDKLEDTKAEIEAHGGRAYVYGCDLSDLEAIDALCEQLAAEHDSDRLRGQQRRPLDPPLAGARRRTGSTTSSAPCSSTTSARSGW